jgi:2-hydroxychromene-2-carboxylate isomerase
MSGEVTFYYDFSSPFSYLASTQIERVAQENGAKVRFRPFLLGALFKKIGTPEVPLFTFPEPKRRYMLRDLTDWASFWRVELKWPSRFPMRTIAPLRLALAVGESHIARVTHAIYRGYWVEDRDIADAAVLRAICTDAGLPADAVERGLAPDQAIKQALIDVTDEAVAAGVCGAPSFVVRGHLFWGQDRLDLVARTLAGWEPPQQPV